jgi:hypothetical protein
MHDFIDDLLRDTDDDTEDAGLPDLKRERFERLNYLKYTDWLASPDSRLVPHLPVTTRYASVRLSDRYRMRTAGRKPPLLIVSTF